MRIFMSYQAQSYRTKMIITTLAVGLFLLQTQTASSLHFTFIDFHTRQSLSPKIAKHETILLTLMPQRYRNNEAFQPPLIAIEKVEKKTGLLAHLCGLDHMFCTNTTRNILLPLENLLDNTTPTVTIVATNNATTNSKNVSVMYNDLVDIYDEYSFAKTKQSSPPPSLANLLEQKLLFMASQLAAKTIEDLSYLVIINKQTVDEAWMRQQLAHLWHKAYGRLALLALDKDQLQHPKDAELQYFLLIDTAKNGPMQFLSRRRSNPNRI
jgi:hypothetical protein